MKRIKNTDKVLDFIKRRFQIDSHFLDGNCYYFAVILKSRFPKGDIYYDVIDGHFIFKINNKFYDFTGEINVSSPVKWSDFNDYDSLQKLRIIRDCIL